MQAPSRVLMGLHVAVVAELNTSQVVHTASSRKSRNRLQVMIRWLIGIIRFSTPHFPPISNLSTFLAVAFLPQVGNCSFPRTRLSVFTAKRPRERDEPFIKNEKFLATDPSIVP